MTDEYLYESADREQFLVFHLHCLFLWKRLNNDFVYENIIEIRRKNDFMTHKIKKTRKKTAIFMKRPMKNSNAVGSGIMSRTQVPRKSHGVPYTLYNDNERMKDVPQK